MMKVVALAGGVGGARMVDGLARCLSPEDLSVIVNIGDDFDHLGLRICPDLDTVCYTLAGIANPETGWGLEGETWNALESLVNLGGPDWFHLGDRDLGTHLERTRRLRGGWSLSQICRDFCAAWGINCAVMPASDDDIPTRVYTEDGAMLFQEYFVHLGCAPVVTGFKFEHVERAAPAPGVLPAISVAELVVICPSNPWVSIDPMLAIPGMRSALSGHLIVAVSPLIGGRAVKGPAAKMFAELGIEPSALAVARHYGSLINGFVIDQVDESLVNAIHSEGIDVLVTDTLMKTNQDRQRLAGEILGFASSLRNQQSSNISLVDRV
jgi:LPPG:FO 2-phospho-L-lactate transferase